MKNPFRKTPKQPEMPVPRLKGNHRPHLTYLLIGTAIAVYIAEMTVLFTRGADALEQVFGSFGFSAAAIGAGGWWTPFTSIFLHAGADHLLLNMIAMFFFGKVVEEELGSRKFALIFVTSALAGDGAIMLSNLFGIMPANVPTIGMSAAIFGLMGAAMLAKPMEIVMHPYVIPMPLLLVAAVYVLYNVASFVAVMATGSGTDIAYPAHLGGIITGAYFGFRAVGRKKGLPILLVLIAILAVVPFIWGMIEQLQVFSWVNALQQIMKG
ncbi:MAG: rhomboid family intramembrane serine protease [Candidatus Aenigmatarchaeota archaeon]